MGSSLIRPRRDLPAGSDGVEDSQHWLASASTLETLPSTVAPLGRVHILPPTRYAFRAALQIKEKGYHAGRDEEFDALVLDEAAEDKVCTVAG
jgi:hypothetical protein